MKIKTAHLILSLGVLFNFASQAYTQEKTKVTHRPTRLKSDAELSLPPTKYSKEIITQWINEVSAELKPSLPIRIMDTWEWQNYVNFDHFVPVTADPHGGESIGATLYDFNWDKSTFKSNSKFSRFKCLPLSKGSISG